MLNSIIDWSARNRFLVLLATLFITLAGIYALIKTPLDALPDLSDVQVIVYTEYSGQAPQVVEDQVTYPLTTAMLAVPKSKVVRGFSFFGASFVYVIFEDGTDIYWARSRVLEYLNSIAGRLPKNVSPQLGPDATGVGWVYQYAVLSEKHNLAELRTMQDWYLRYQLTKAHGVAEVASIGGFVQQYQVTVDPVKLRAYNIPLSKVSQVIRDSNRDVGGRVIEMAETEYMVRGKGYLRGKSDIENLVVKADRGTPVLLRDIARVELGPDERRGLTELNGEGEVVSGIVMARFGHQTEDCRGLRRATGWRDDKGGVRPLRVDSARHSDAQTHVAGGRHHRRRRVYGVLDACAQRAGRHRDAAHRRVDRLHRDAFARAELQHHEPGRDCHCHRRDGGCGHRDDRERA
jgi:Cu(I)/Ag(I) efflux system membrane protein CusA/SilA